jgi:hypothetical protein
MKELGPMHLSDYQCLPIRIMKQLGFTFNVISYHAAAAAAGNIARGYLQYQVATLDKALLQS